MPYKEKYYRVVPTNYELDQKIKRMQVKTELKFKDTWVVSVNGDDPDSGAGQYYLLNGVSQGTSANAERIGNEIYPTSIQFRGFAYINNLEEVNLDDALRAPFLRMIIFWDKGANGANPLIIGNSENGDESLLDLTNSAASPIWAPYSHSTATRFKILYDETIHFTPSSEVYRVSGEDTLSDASVPNRFLQAKIPLSRTTRYTGDGNTIDTISENSLFVTFISTFDQVPSVNYSISADILFRLYYKDE